MNFKITEFPKTLCQSCVNGQVTDFHGGTRKVWCHHGMDVRLMERPVLECSIYEQKGKMTEHEAKKLGWVLEFRRTAGFHSNVSFVPPKKEE